MRYFLFNYTAQKSNGACYDGMMCLTYEHFPSRKEIKDAIQLPDIQNVLINYIYEFANKEDYESFNIEEETIVTFENWLNSLKERLVTVTSFSEEIISELIKGKEEKLLEEFNSGVDIDNAITIFFNRQSNTNLDES